MQDLTNIVKICTDSPLTSPKYFLATHIFFIAGMILKYFAVSVDVHSVVTGNHYEEKNLKQYLNKSLMFLIIAASGFLDGTFWILGSETGQLLSSCLGFWFI